MTIRTLAFIYAFLSFLPIVGMQSQEVTITLAIDGTANTLPLKNVLTHISRCQLIPGTQKITGFHHYTYQTKQAHKTGTLAKVSSALWVYTQGNPDDFHIGHIIYRGHVYSQPKTFFPCSWSTQQIVDYVEKQTTQQQVGTAKVVDNKIFFKYSLRNLEENTPSVEIVIERNLRSQNTRINTLYPVITTSNNLLDSVLQSILTELAHQQLQAKKTIVAQPTLTPALLAAIKENNTLQALNLIETGADIRQRDTNQHTALMLAAKAGNWSIVTALLDHDADVHAVDEQGNSALWYAILSQDNYVLLALLDTLEINRPNNAGVTPLIYALNTKNSDTIDTLLAYGADPNAPDSFGLTPLMHVVRLNTDNDQYKEFVALLLSYHANTHIQNRDGNTILHDAINYLGDKAVDVIKLLLQAHADYDMHNDVGQTALSIARAHHCTRIVELLQNTLQAKREWITDYQSTELMYALHTHNLYKAEQLIAQQPDINHVDITGATALSRALEHNNQNLIDQLLTAGADTTLVVNGKTIYQQAQEHEQLSTTLKQRISLLYNHAMAPIFEQQRKQQEQQMQLTAQEAAHKKQVLTQFKQETDAGHLSDEFIRDFVPFKNTALNDKKLTPLMFAIMQNKPHVVKQLLELTVDVQAQTTDQLDALAIAYDIQDTTILNDLIASRKFSKQQLQHVWERAITDKAFTLTDTIAQFGPSIRHQAVIDAITTNNSTLFDALVNAQRLGLYEQDVKAAIFTAAQQKNAHYTATLLDLYPAAHDNTNHLGQTPLMTAALCNNVTSMVTLLHKGAATDAQDNLQKTIFQYTLHAQAQSIINSTLQKQLDKQQAIEQAERDAQAQEQQAIRQRKIAHFKSRGYTPLMIAAYENNTRAIDQLDKTAELMNPDGSTALMIAVYKKHYNAIKSLLALSPNALNVQDVNGNTALMHAVTNNDVKAVKLLLRAEPNVKLRNKAHEDIIKIAENHKQQLHPTIKRMIFKPKSDIHEHNYKRMLTSCVQITSARKKMALGISALFLLICYWLCNDAIAHINSPALYTATSNSLYRLPMQQYAHGNTDHTQAVTESDTEGYFNLNGYTPLMIAAYKDDVEAISKADLTSQHTNDYGQTPLIVAVKKKSHKALTKLLSLFPDTLNAQDTSGNTALMFAVHYNNAKAVELLLEAKPNLLLTNNAGQNVFVFLHFVSQHLDPKIIKLILQAAAQLLPDPNVHYIMQMHEKDLAYCFSALAQSALLALPQDSRKNRVINKDTLRRAYYKLATGQDLSAKARQTTSTESALLYQALYKEKDAIHNLIHAISKFHPLMAYAPEKLQFKINTDLLTTTSLVADLFLISDTVKPKLQIPEIAKQVAHQATETKYYFQPIEAKLVHDNAQLFKIRGTIYKLDETSNVKNFQLKLFSVKNRNSVNVELLTVKENYEKISSILEANNFDTNNEQLRPVFDEWLKNNFVTLADDLISTQVLTKVDANTPVSMVCNIGNSLFKIVDHEFIERYFNNKQLLIIKKDGDILSSYFVQVSDETNYIISKFAEGKIPHNIDALFNGLIAQGQVISLAELMNKGIMIPIN